MKKSISILLILTCLSTALFCAYAEAGHAPIGEADARAVALEHAALAEGDVSALTVTRDREDGREVYEVEFWRDATEYDYDVDVGAGEIIAFDIESKGPTLPHLGEAAISPEDALKAALEAARVSEAGATIREAALKYRDGAAKYKFEFTADGVEYEVEINAADGAVLECDFEGEDD